MRPDPFCRSAKSLVCVGDSRGCAIGKLIALHGVAEQNEGLQLTRSTREVACEIKRYCAAHPGARDTLEGMAWWLAIQRCSESMEELRAAVDFLVEQKVLVPYRLNDGTTVFGCSADEGENGCE